jgi:2-aminoadipate transaminase
MRENDVIIVENPTYFIAPPIFKDYHYKLVSVPMESDGMDLEALEVKVKETKPKLVYTIPVYHNPSGITMSVEKRKKLIKLSQKYNFKILADEVYQNLNYDDSSPPPPEMCTLDDCLTGGTVYSVGTFSKTICPGLKFFTNNQRHETRLDTSESKI